MENEDVKKTNTTNEETNIYENNTQAGSCGFSIASMVLGIIAVLSCFFWFITIPCGILAIVFSVIRKKKGGKKMATAGLILGITALVLFTLLITAIIALSIGMAISEYPLTI